MPPSNIRKSRRQRGRRRRAYLLGTLIIIIAVGWYVYASAQSASNRAPATIVYAKLNTSQGLIEVELYQGKTPQTVANFVTLARSGFYDYLVWHRIVNGFAIQTGDPNTRYGEGDRSQWGRGGSSQTVPYEGDASLHNHFGYLGMAHSGDPNGASSQFYINLKDNSHLDGIHAVFGKVIKGMDVALAIANVPTYTQNPYKDQPIDPVFLTGATISDNP